MDVGHVGQPSRLKTSAVSAGVTASWMKIVTTSRGFWSNQDLTPASSVCISVAPSSQGVTQERLFWAEGLLAAQPVDGALHRRRQRARPARRKPDCARARSAGQ